MLHSDEPMRAQSSAHSAKLRAPSEEVAHLPTRLSLEALGSALEAFLTTHTEQSAAPPVSPIAGIDLEPPEVRALQRFVKANSLDRDLCLLLSVAWHYPTWSRDARFADSVLVPFSRVDDDAKSGEFKALVIEWEGISYRLALASSYSLDDDIDEATLTLSDSTGTRWLALDVERHMLSEYFDWRPVRVAGFIPGTWALALKRALAHYSEGRRQRDRKRADERAREQAKAFGLE